MTDEELAEARALCEAATPGPWRIGTCQSGKVCWCRIVLGPDAESCIVSDGSAGVSDARFIAAARSLVPRLLAEVDRLRDRVRTIADEAFGPLPVQTADEALTAIEQGVFAQRQEVERLATIAESACRELARLRSVIDDLLARQDVSREGLEANLRSISRWATLFLSLPAYEVPGLRAERDALRAEVARLTAEERKWRHAGADGIDAMAEHLAKAQDEIARLTSERNETQAALNYARNGVNNYRTAYLAYQDWAASRSARLLSLASSDRAYRDAIDAALEIGDPPEEPHDGAIASREVACECCGGMIALGTDVAVWRDGERFAVMHWGPCPEPDMWEIRWTYRSGETGHTTKPRSLEEAFAYAVDFKRRYPDMPRVRLVRCKEPRR